MSVAGRTDLNGGFRLDVLNTPDSSYRIVVVTDGCASDTEAHHPFFVDTILPKLGIAATANDVIAAFRSESGR
jgi:hypothetical protein